VEKYCTARQATDDNIIRRIAFWILKATNLLSEYVILRAFPLQRRLHECTSVSLYAYITCLLILQFHRAYFILI